VERSYIKSRRHSHDTCLHWNDDAIHSFSYILYTCALQTNEGEDDQMMIMDVGMIRDWLSISYVQSLYGSSPAGVTFSNNDCNSTLA